VRAPLVAALLLAPLAASAAPPTTPPPSPFPTDAQCQALGPVRRPLAFGPGESLEFDVDALGAKAGSMAMRVLPQAGDGRWRLEVTVQTNTFFSKVRSVKGTATSFDDPKTLRPQRYLEDAVENGVRRVADVTFQKNRVANLVSISGGATTGRQLGFGNDVSDVAGAVYLLRALPLEEGQSLCFDVYAIRRIWRVWGTVLPREPVSMPLGEFTALHLAGQAAPLGMPDARREVHVWVSDDARRLPLAALGTIDLGAVRATLKAVSRPHERPARAENKANLTW
jgi:hypothetical protein